MTSPTRTPSSSRSPNTSPQRPLVFANFIINRRMPSDPISRTQRAENIRTALKRMAKNFVNIFSINQSIENLPVDSLVKKEPNPDGTFSRTDACKELTNKNGPISEEYFVNALHNLTEAANHKDHTREDRQPSTAERGESSQSAPKQPSVTATSANTTAALPSANANSTPINAQQTPPQRPLVLSDFSIVRSMRGNNILPPSRAQRAQHFKSVLKTMAKNFTNIDLVNDLIDNLSTDALVKNEQDLNGMFMRTAALKSLTSRVDNLTEEEYFSKKDSHPSEVEFIQSLLNIAETATKLHQTGEAPKPSTAQHGESSQMAPQQAGTSLTPALPDTNNDSAPLSEEQQAARQQKVDSVLSDMEDCLKRALPNQHETVEKVISNFKKIINPDLLVKARPNEGYDGKSPGDYSRTDEVKALCGEFYYFMDPAKCIDFIKNNTSQST